MEWYWLVAFYTVLCKIYLFLGMRSGTNNLVKLVLKCAPILYLLVLVGMEVAQRGAPIAATSPGSTKKLFTLLWGLVFSIIGDAYLVFSSYFLYGVVAFSIAQAIYISLFEGGLSLFFHADANEVTSGVAIAAVSLAVYIYLLPKLEKALMVPTAIYCLLISLMLWSAVVQVQRRPNDLTLVGAVGACMYYTSDLLLAVNKWRLRVPFGPVLIMTTYYTAQLFITGSVVGFD